MKKFKLPFSGNPRFQAAVLGVLILITGGLFLRSVQARSSRPPSDEVRSLAVPVTGAESSQTTNHSGLTLPKIDLSLLRQSIFDQIINPKEAEGLYQRIEQSLNEPVKNVNPLAVAQAATATPGATATDLPPTPTISAFIIPTLTPMPTGTPTTTPTPTPYYMNFITPATQTKQPDTGGNTKPRRKTATPAPTDTPQPTNPPQPTDTTQPTNPPPQPTDTTQPPQPTDPPQPPPPTVVPATPQPTIAEATPREQTPIPKPTKKPKPTHPPKPTKKPHKPHKH